MNLLVRTLKFPVRTVYVGLLDLRQQWRYNKNLGFLYDGLRQQWYKLFMGNLGSHSYIQNVRMAYPQNIFIGDNVTIGHGVYINATPKVHIGDNTMISSGGSLLTASHDLSDEDLHASVEALPIRIGSNCWVASNCTILGGVTIGDRAIIAAGAVVTRDVEAGTVVAGIPAKEIKKRTHSGNG